MNLNVHPVHFTADQKLIDLVKEKIQKLEQFHDKINRVDVYLKLENVSEQIKDKVVEIKVNVSHTLIFVKHISKTFEESLTLSLNSTINKLKKTRQKEMSKR
jgi:putative sigma-54 modulation protein